MTRLGTGRRASAPRAHLMAGWRQPCATTSQRVRWLLAHRRSGLTLAAMRVTTHGEAQMTTNGFGRTGKRSGVVGRPQLRHQRLRRGWSLDYVADKLHDLGIARGVPPEKLGADARMVSRWELGRSEPAERYIALLCLLFNLPPEQLDLPKLVIEFVPQASQDSTTSVQHEVPTATATTASVSSDGGGAETERRDVLRYGVGTAITIVSGAVGEWLGGRSESKLRTVDPLALLGYPSLVESAVAQEPSDVEGLRRRVTAARQAYQRCQYEAMTKELPGLLADVTTATQVMNGSAQLTAFALSAEAHHVTASLLLKHDDQGTAWVAADRSLRAAERTGDPSVIASSARIVTHALMSSGHHLTAAEAASRAARQFASEWSQPTADDLSIYGSLLLRGAVAASRHGKRDHAYELLEEATSTARRVGQDYSHRSTAFGPINIDLHRVHIAVTLGDAGQALDLANRIDVNSVPMTERRVSLLVDTALALWQCGRYEQCYKTVRTAEAMAPEEVAARPIIRRLALELLMHAPRYLMEDLKAFAERVGAVGIQ